MNWVKIVFSIVIFMLASIYLMNASWRVSVKQADPYFVAHRGVHQTHTHEGINDQSCTAELIYPPTHDYIENTLPSIQAAFQAGADIVEIDIHPTIDGDFAVFHDWSLECRTNGSGITRQQTMSYLRTLDAGYGYTADNGQSYPLRGQAIGLIPSLSDVLDAFPDGQFLINFKGGEASEADLLSDYLLAIETDLDRILVYGAETPVARFAELHPNVRHSGRKTMVLCAKEYLLTGWFGRVPEQCENTILFLPVSHAQLMWGWPDRFQQRMDNANVQVFLIGNWDGQRSFTTGIDDTETLERVPASFSGGIWTNRIETINPSIER